MEEQIYDQKILEAAEIAVGEESTDVFTLASGVVLKALRVPPLRIDAVQRQFKDPKIPEDVLDDGRKVPNPDRKDYKEAKEKVEQERNLALADALMLFGTELVSCPETIESPDSDEWVEEMELFGITIPEKPKVRYLAWLRYVAIVNVEHDLALIMKHVMGRMAISEENIAEALEGFRGNETRGTDSHVLGQTSS